MSISSIETTGVYISRTHKDQINLQLRDTMRCEYLSLLFMLWMKFAGARVLMSSQDVEWQSIIEDLGEALKVYESSLTATPILKELTVPMCTEAMAPSDQESFVSSKLTEYQKCVEPLGSLALGALCDVVKLNNDVLQYLKSNTSDCPSSSSLSAPSTDYNLLLKPLQCVQCWIQQVETLGKKQT